MKTAYFVIGPESSGTRMLSECLIRSGVYGSAGHYQQFDRSGFRDAPDAIVFRRSIPHANEWPDLAALQKQMEQAGYHVVPIFIRRIKKYAVLSQIKAGHVTSGGQANKNIDRAVKIVSEYEKDGAEMIRLKYEQFVENPEYRAAFFERIGRNEPKMRFYNANEKYG